MPREVSKVGSFLMLFPRHLKDSSPPLLFPEFRKLLNWHPLQRLIYVTLLFDETGLKLCTDIPVVMRSYVTGVVTHWL